MNKFYEKPFGKFAKTAICLVLISSVQINGYAANCGDPRGVADAAATKYEETTKKVIASEKNLIKVKDLQKTMALKASMDCFQKLKMLLDMIATFPPALPSLNEALIAMVIEQLKKMLCNVIITQVDKLIVDPITGVVTGIESTINGIPTIINDATGVIGVPVLTPGTKSSSVLSNPSLQKSIVTKPATSITPSVTSTATPVTTKPPKTGSIWDRMGCTLTFGNNC